MVPDPAALLRERGIQVTAQRLAVLRAVAGQPHITADAVAEVVRTEIGAISLQSVYDALSLLVAEGLIRRIQPSGSAARFEDRVGDNHHHLICRTCGRVVDVDCAVGVRAVSHGDRRPGLRDRRGRGRLLGTLSGLSTVRRTSAPRRQSATDRPAPATRHDSDSEYNRPRRSHGVNGNVRSARSRARRAAAGRTRNGGRIG